MTAKLKSAVVGATGYSGLELTRILLRHPRVDKPILCRRQSETAGTSDLADIFPSLSGNGGHPLQPLSWATLKQQDVELLFLATPHEASRALVPEAIAQGFRVIDLSGAWRLKQAEHRAVYDFGPEDSLTAAELTAKAVYGLPELHGDSIPDAALVANPGCYATSVILGGSPIAESGDCGPAAGNYFRLQVWRVGRGQGAKRTYSLCLGCRQPVCILRIRSSPCGRNARAVESGYERIDFHPALASDSARNSFDHLRAFEPRDEAGGSGILLPRFL